MIEVRNLSKQFGSKQVLHDINLSFEAGKVYGIVGENGAGKTTLFRCMAGLENFNGDINSDPEPLQHHLGLLLTEPYFFSKITGGEYIRLLCHARKITLPDLESRNVFDLPLNEYASVYSTGMKKKLALTAILLLLEILPDSIEYFTKNTPDFENILITNTRENFEMNSHLQVLPELNTLDWRERTEFPLGMDGEGVFFAVDGLQDQLPR